MSQEIFTIFAKLKYDSKKNRQENLELKVVHSEKELELEKERTTNIIGAVSSGSLVFALLGAAFHLYFPKTYTPQL